MYNNIIAIVCITYNIFSALNFEIICYFQNDLLNNILSVNIIN